MDWRPWILECYATRGSRTRPDFRAGASQEQIDQVQAVLGLRVPAALRERLLQSDGVGELWLSVNGVEAPDDDPSVHAWYPIENVAPDLAISAGPSSSWSV
jgi:cell wall assembly regulator SMI1